MARTDYGAILSTKIADTSQAIRDVNKTVGLIAPADWGTLIRTMKSASDYDNALAQMIEETITSTPIAHITDGAEAIPVKSLTAEITPIQAGTGTPSPSNPRSISGRTEVKVTRTGANVINGTELAQRLVANGATIDTTNKTVYYSGSVARSTGVIFNKFKPNTNYTIMAKVATGSVGNINVKVFYTNGTNINLTDMTAETMKVWTSSNIDYVTFEWVTGSTLLYYEQFGIFEGTLTASDYKPYTGEVTTISLGTTVYGGTLDVTRGKLSVTHGYFTADDTANWTNVGGSYPFAFQLDTGITNKVDNPIASQGIVCNLFPQGTTDVPSTNAIRWQVGGSTGRLYVYDYDHSGDLTAFKAMLQSTPLQMAYKLATPTEIDLTPEEVTTLLGENNIFADSGNVEVVYRANGSLYVAQHT